MPELRLGSEIQARAGGWRAKGQVLDALSVLASLLLFVLETLPVLHCPKHSMAG